MPSAPPRSAQAPLFRSPNPDCFPSNQDRAAEEAWAKSPQQRGNNTIFVGYWFQFTRPDREAWNELLRTGFVPLEQRCVGVDRARRRGIYIIRIDYRGGDCTYINKK